MWVNRAFNRLHQLNRTSAQLLVEVFPLPDAYTVFARTYNFPSATTLGAEKLTYMSPRAL